MFRRGRVESVICTGSFWSPSRPGLPPPAPFEVGIFTYSSAVRTRDGQSSKRCAGRYSGCRYSGCKTGRPPGPLSTDQKYGNQVRTIHQSLCVVRTGPALRLVAAKVRSVAYRYSTLLDRSWFQSRLQFVQDERVGCRDEYAAEQLPLIQARVVPCVCRRHLRAG